MVTPEHLTNSPTTMFLARQARICASIPWSGNTEYLLAWTSGKPGSLWRSTRFRGQTPETVEFRILTLSPFLEFMTPSDF